MPMDRTPEWETSLIKACHAQGLSQEQVLGTKANLLLKPRKQPSEFIKVSKAVVQSISDLREFIKLHQKDYLSASASSKDEKDRVEAEVGLLIKACAQQIEQLKNSVLAAQGSAQAPPASVHALKQQQRRQEQLQEKECGGKPAINAQTAAHLHGVVLYIAELLHQVSSRFDKCRAQRYQQASNQRRPLSFKVTQQLTSQGASRVTGEGAPSSLSTSTGPPRPCVAAGRGGPSTPAQAALNKFGTSILGHVREARDALQGIDTPGANGADQDSSQNKSRELQPVQQQQQLQLNLENQNLVAQLSVAAAQAQGIESTIQDIAILNQMFSTAVLHQAESIESIYMAAVDASQNISTGNVELRKAVEYGRSSQRLILLFFLVASLGLLFLDWFNS